MAFLASRYRWLYKSRVASRVSMELKELDEFLLARAMEHDFTVEWSGRGPPLPQKAP
ncbi:hypothetical protein ACFQ1S_09710 [Kibdelosporangium lantanae]|uniref:Uncharacterized protein n=1 Tax=Kibdelosporangium lantanae TaxID=1497396 RepID=A0ABW3M5C0_9PSEU